MGKELVQKTNLKREIGWMYFVDKEGDICRGKMGALIQVDPAKSAPPLNKNPRECVGLEFAN